MVKAMVQQAPVPISLSSASNFNYQVETLAADANNGIMIQQPIQGVTLAPSGAASVKTIK